MPASWKPFTPIVGHQAISTNETVQKHPLGLRIKAVHDSNGEGEFIYLKGVASTVVGSWVTYSADDWTTTLLVGNAKGQVAIAMSACVASEYGWYQISGKASAIAADVADSADVYIDSLAGTCDDAVVTGDRVHRAKWRSAEDTATNLADVEIFNATVDDGAGSGST